MLAAAALAAALGGAPGEPSMPLQWHAAAGCDEGPRARARLAQLLEPSPLRSGWRASARIRAAERGWTAVVRVHAASGTTERTLHGTPCSSLADAVALVVAITVDPLGASVSIDEPPAVVEPEVPDPSRPLPQPAGATGAAVIDPPNVDVEAGAGPPTDPVAVTRNWTPVVSGVVRGGIDAGLLPGAVGWGGGALALQWGELRLSLAGLWVQSRMLEHPLATGSGALISHGVGRASGCWAPRTKWFAMPICGGVEAGALPATGVGLEQIRRTTVPWLAVVPHAQPTLWAVPWLGLGFTLEVPIPVLRPAVAIDDFADELARIEPLGVRVGLALEVVFFDEDRRRRRTGRSGG